MCSASGDRIPLEAGLSVSTCLRELIEGSQDCSDELDIALVVQYFKRPSILSKLLGRLKALPGTKEILINNDSASEVPVFLVCMQCHHAHNRITVELVASLPVSNLFV